MPKKIVVGVTAGIFGAAQGEEKQRYAGLYWKANYALTRGTNFLQIDLESISEFQEPNIKENMKKFYALGFTAGLHSETPSFGSREFPHLDAALETDWRRSHDRLIHILDKAGELGFEYMLMHSSESTPFIFLTKDLQPSEVVDIWGRQLEKFIEEEGELSEEKEDPITHEKKKRNWIKEWLLSPNQEYIWEEFGFRSPTKIIEEARKERGLTFSESFKQRLLESKYMEKALKKVEEKEAATADLENKDEKREKKEERVDEEKEIEKLKKEVALTPEQAKQAERYGKVFYDLTKEEREHLIKENSLEALFTELKSRRLHYGPERIAYYITAKWMERNNDEMWNNIVNVTVKYYMKRDGFNSVEEWKKAKRIERFSIDDQNFRRYYQLWVPAVSAKFVWGHFMIETCPDKEHAERFEDPKKYFRKHENEWKHPIFFVLETPMASSGTEDLLRFPQPAQMYYLVKELNKHAEGMFAIAVDLEHMLMDGLNIEAAIDALPEDGGKYIRVIHTGWPSPLGPAHIPIPVGSEQQRYLYEVYYKLRQKGMLSKWDTFLVFERGGGEDPFKQSIIALRMIKEHLEKDPPTPPDKLPPEFYGISPEGFLSEQRQLAIIKEHYWDPLKGVITQPEEDYTFLGTAALQKGKRPEEWKKEELR